MKRREFFQSVLMATGLVTSAGSAVSQSTVPTIAFLSRLPLEGWSHLPVAFRAGLEGQGFVDGRNVRVEYWSVVGDLGRLSAVVEDVVKRRVDVIVATGSGDPAAAMAAKEATNSIPIVAITGGDPVKLGLVASLNRPGGNVTGVNNLVTELAGKRLELLRHLARAEDTYGAFINPRNPNVDVQEKEINDAARALRINVELIRAGTVDEIEVGFQRLAAVNARSVFFSADPFFGAQARLFAARAQEARLPAMYALREYALAGGLMSYGPSATLAYRLAGEYAGRILKGERPADLPVQQPTRFELVLNLKTAKALGLEFPATLLAIADEVIE